MKEVIFHRRGGQRGPDELQRDDRISNVGPLPCIGTGDGGGRHRGRCDHVRARGSACDRVSLLSLSRSEEADAAAKVEEDRINKELRPNMVKKEKQYNEAVGRYRNAEMYAEDMTRSARGLSKEQVVSQVIEFAHVRSLPTYDTKNMLLDRLKLASDAAEAFGDAVEEESGPDDSKNRVNFDVVEEDASVQDLVTMLNLLLNAKVEYNGKRSTGSDLAAPRSTPIKVKLNTPKFSGRSRDFAIYKKEFMDVIVPGRSDPEIGALLREGLNTKEKNLLRNNEMANYM